MALSAGLLPDRVKKLWADRFPAMQQKGQFPGLDVNHRDQQRAYHNMSQLRRKNKEDYFGRRDFAFHLKLLINYRMIKGGKINQ